MLFSSLKAVRLTFVELATLKFAEFITTCPLSIHIKLIPNYFNLGIVPPCKEVDLLCKWCVRFAASRSLAATTRMSVAFFQSCSMYQWKLLKIAFLLIHKCTNIDIKNKPPPPILTCTCLECAIWQKCRYVTFRLSSRPLFCPRLKKLWSITYLSS